MLGTQRIHAAIQNVAVLSIALVVFVRNFTQHEADGQSVEMLNQKNFRYIGRTMESRYPASNRKPFVSRASILDQASQNPTAFPSGNGPQPHQEAVRNQPPAPGYYYYVPNIAFSEPPPPPETAAPAEVEEPQEQPEVAPPPVPPPPPPPPPMKGYWNTPLGSISYDANGEKIDPADAADVSTRAISPASKSWMLRSFQRRNQRSRNSKEAIFLEQASTVEKALAVARKRLQAALARTPVRK